MPIFPAIDQYPVTITSSSRPVKAAGFPGPFQIINLNTSATVWLADNQNVSDGHGIPLNPGSSLTWTGSQNTQELWAVLGTDTSSVGQTVTLIIGASVMGWQQNPVAFAIAALNAGVILVDNPVTLFNAASGAGTVTSAFFDVSTFQSLAVVCIPANACTLQLQWWDAAHTVQIGFDQWAFTAADLGALNTHVPCRGAAMRFVKTGVANFSLQLVGSHRPWSSLMNIGPQDRMLLANQHAAVASAGIVTDGPSGYHYDGPAVLTIRAVTVGAAQPIQGVVSDLVTTRTIIAFKDPGLVALGTSFVALTIPFIAPRNSWQISIQNIGAAAQNIDVAAIASPEGT